MNFIDLITGILAGFGAGRFEMSNGCPTAPPLLFSSIFLGSYLSALDKGLCVVCQTPTTESRMTVQVLESVSISLVREFLKRKVGSH